MPNEPNEISLPFGFKVTFIRWERQDFDDAAVLSVSAEDNAPCAPNGYALYASISDGELAVIPCFFYNMGALAVIISLEEQKR